MANAPRRAERMARQTETIGGEQFTTAATAEAPQGSIQDERLARVRTIAAAGKGFVEVLRALGESRELSIARQRIEEAVMWATKHCVK